MFNKFFEPPDAFRFQTSKRRKNLFFLLRSVALLKLLEDLVGAFAFSMFENLHGPDNHQQTVTDYHINAGFYTF